MRAAGCLNFVYSSSATVYGEPKTIPIPESSPLVPESPYAKSKVFCEWMLMDIAKGEHHGQAHPVIPPRCQLTPLNG
jgi:UDP-glucose 4-epimerase